MVLLVVVKRVTGRHIRRIATGSCITTGRGALDVHRGMWGRPGGDGCRQGVSGPFAEGARTINAGDYLATRAHPVRGTDYVTVT